MINNYTALLKVLMKLINKSISTYYVCFPSWKWAFFDDLKVSKNSVAFWNSCFFLDLSHLCSVANISMMRGNARPAASVSRKASRDLLAMKSTADSQYSCRAQYATSASRKGYPWASLFPRFSFWRPKEKGLQKLTTKTTWIGFKEAVHHTTEMWSCTISELTLWGTPSLLVNLLGLQGVKLNQIHNEASLSLKMN